MRGQALLPLLFLFGACGEEVARVPLDGFGEESEAEVTLDGGTEIDLWVHLGKYSHRGYNRILVDAKLLNDGKIIEKVQCAGFELDAGAGSGCGSAQHNSSCSMTVPKRGADAIRVEATLQTGGEVDVEGMEVGVRVHR